MDITNNSSTIDQNQMLAEDSLALDLTTRYRLSFTIKLNSTDVNETIVQNIDRALVNKTSIKISGNEIMTIDDSGV